MIPKTIHYCWFGHDPLPPAALKCIESWKKYFPGFEIIEWNESNYDVEKIPYIKEAYQNKKYAFVSDYARFDILYENGGVYFDTDVEVIKPFDDILDAGPFMGCEIDPGQDTRIKVAPGLGLAAVPGMEIYRSILDFYETQSFLNPDGSINTETVVTKTTNVLKENGLENKSGIQTVCGVTIYPVEYFNPMNSLTGKITITGNTHSIHRYSMSWLSDADRRRSRITRVFRRIFGTDFFNTLKRGEK
jgi:hypothetical protein